MEIWTLIISISAFVVSLLTFLHKVYTNRFKSTAKVLSIHEVPHNGFYMKILITNHSSNPVSVTSVHVDGVINVNEKQVALGGNKIKSPLYTDTLPVSIGGYGAVSLILFFRNIKRIYEYNEIVPIEINTSRKPINDEIEIKNLQQKLFELRN